MHPNQNLCKKKSLGTLFQVVFYILFYVEKCRIHIKKKHRVDLGAKIRFNSQVFVSNVYNLVFDLLLHNDLTAGGDLWMGKRKISNAQTNQCS